MTREHVFARWLIQKVHGAKLVPSGDDRAGPAEADPRLARITADVCATCNAGWMSGLEVAFRRIIFARSRAGPIPAPDRITLSRWFAKTALLLADARGCPLIPDERRPALLTGMPEEVEVFVARRRRPRQPIDFRIDPATAPERPTAVARSVAVLVGDLVAGVAARGTLGRAHGTQLSPLRTHTVRWETIPVRPTMEAP